MPSMTTCKCGEQFVSAKNKGGGWLRQCVPCRTESICWDCANAVPSLCGWVDKQERVWDKAYRAEVAGQRGKSYIVWKVYGCRNFVPEVEQNQERVQVV